MYKKINKEKTLFFVLFVSLFWLKEINYLFYNIAESPDFQKYFVYFEHFFTNKATNHEHGLLYYYLHSLHLSTFFENDTSLEFALHKSVLDVNFYLFLIGLLGIFKLLKLFKFNNSSIAYTLIFLNFFPPSISLRLVFKPEVLAFALFPWVIYLLEKFKKTNNVLYLIIALPLTVTTISLKGNILVITCVYLLISNYSIFKKIKISTFSYLALGLIVLFCLVTIENNKSNGKNILDIQSGASLEANYDFKAPRSIIYKTNIYDLFSSPVKHKHADSFIAITLLETNGDYFDLYWDNDATQFFKNRLELFEFENSNEIKAPKFNEESKSITIYQQRSTDVYIYESISLILSIILFLSLIISIIYFPNYRNYLIAIFVGMGVILIHAITGYPTNNFDPLVGDTFKPLYYSFTLLLSFAFVIAIFAENKFFRVAHLLIYCGLIVFILGFPKNDVKEFDGFFVQKIENSQLCEVEKKIYLDDQNLEVQCNTKKAEIVYEHFYTNKLFHKPINFLLGIFNTVILIFLLFENRILIFIKNRQFTKNK